MAFLLSLSHILFEKTRGRNKKGKWAWVYPHARELYSKDVEDLGTEAMATPQEQRTTAVWSTTRRSTDNHDHKSKTSNHGHLYLFPNQLKLTSNERSGCWAPWTTCIYLDIFSIYLCIFLNIYLSLYLSIYLYIYLSISISISSLSLSLSIYLHLYLSLSIYLYLYLSLYLSICLSIYPSISLSLSPSFMILNRRSELA